MSDWVVARLRPGWIRNRLPFLLQRYERFAPCEWIPLPEGRRLAVVAPHPDDESIGPGGFAAAWGAEAGRTVEVVFLTDGAAGDRRLRAPDLSADAQAAIAAEVADRRRAEASAALGVLRANGHWLGGPDGKLALQEDRMVDALAAHWAAHPPDLIMAPFPADRHVDHAAAARIVGRAALRSLAGDLPLLAYEVWSPLPANVLFDISHSAETKWRAIAMHESQTATTDYVNAARALATYRGIAGGRPCPAEAFYRSDVAEYAAMAQALKP